MHSNTGVTVQMKVLEHTLSKEEGAPTHEDGGGQALRRAMQSLRLHFAHVTERVQEMAKGNLMPQRDGRVVHTTVFPPLSEQAKLLQTTVAKLVRLTCLVCICDMATPSAHPESCCMSRSISFTRYVSHHCCVPRQSIPRVAYVQVHVEDSLESNYTCLMCLGIFRDPVALAPCGHVYCRTCLDSTRHASRESGAGWCQECGGLAVQHALPIANLDNLASKYEFKLGALEDLKSLCKGQETIQQQ